MQHPVGMDPVVISALIVSGWAIGMTILVLLLAYRQGGKLSSKRLKKATHALRNDTLILLLIGAGAGGLYALMGDMTPRLAHAMWLSAGIVGGGALVLGAVISWLRRRSPH
jgi:hypothetical protein